MNGWEGIHWFKENKYSRTNRGINKSFPTWTKQLEGCEGNDFTENKHCFNLKKYFNFISDSIFNNRRIFFNFPGNYIYLFRKQ